MKKYEFDELHDWEQAAIVVALTGTRLSAEELTFNKMLHVSRTSSLDHGLVTVTGRGWSRSYPIRMRSSWVSAFERDMQLLAQEVDQ